MKQIAKIWDWLEESCIVFILVFMTIFNFINVIGRYFFNRSFSSIEELTITGFVYVSMFGIAAAYKRGSHLAMDLITQVVSAKARAWLIVFSVICSLFFLTIIFYLSFDIIGAQIRSGERTSATGLPAYYQRLCIPIGCVLIYIRIFQWGFLEFRKNYFAKEGGN